MARKGATTLWSYSLSSFKTYFLQDFIITLNKIHSLQVSRFSVYEVPDKLRQVLEVWDQHLTIKVCIKYKLYNV